MSSEISKTEKSLWDKWWILLHQRTSHKTRVRLLADRFSTILPSDRPTTCLDIGCGDMQIAELIKSAKPNTLWTCMDIYPLPEHFQGMEKWHKYQHFDGVNIPTESNSFDYVLLCDVLHHSLNPEELLRECARVGKTIILKDHFQYGFFSNLMLKWMDQFGNQAYGVHIPGRYFSTKSFNALCSNIGLRVADIQTGIRLYDHLPIIRKVLRPEWQFIAVLEKT